jgi:5'-phosphate synthase pdxT subunit
LKIGVLALQGDFAEHIEAFERLGAAAFEVRTEADLAAADALAIPGGESTVIAKLASSSGIFDEICRRGKAGMPLFATCAGLIFLARRVLDASEGQVTLGLVDVVVRRNAYGRQIRSFEAELEVPVLDPPKFHGVFIRAPAIEEVGPEAEAIAFLGTNPVGVRQGRIVALSFHPELASDDRLHRYFLDTATTG